MIISYDELPFWGPKYPQKLIKYCNILVKMYVFYWTWVFQNDFIAPPVKSVAST